jgi:hypothetical protein
LKSVICRNGSKASQMVTDAPVIISPSQTFSKK